MVNAEPLVSIIIPIYNVERYMDKCLKTVINQTYKNLEIILVDDGSSDKSGQKADYWKVTDNRIVVIHQDNKGVSSARNTGLGIAKGKYVCFVDSDDWLPSTAVDTLVAKSEENSADCVMGVATAVGVINKEYHGQNSGKVYHVGEVNELLEFTTIVKSQLSPWAKLYKREIIVNNSLVFPVGIAYGEDRIFNWKYFRECKIIATVHDVVYFYSQLNLTRACGRYYSDVNIWMGEAVSNYMELLGNSIYEVRKNVYETAVKQFGVCCEHYGEHIENDDEVYYKKIEQTQIIFKNLIEEYSQGIEEHDDTKLKLVLEPLLETSITELCNTYQVKVGNRLSTNARHIIRNGMVRAKRFYVYGILK